MSFNTEAHPAVAPQAPAQTQGFRFNHTMVRVKDPAVSLQFYSTVFGMRLLRTLDFPEMDFSLYFLAHISPDQPAPEDEAQRTAWTFSQTGVLELTHNYGTENDPDFAYHDGNAEPQGYGHICFSVPDIDAAERWFDDNQVTFIKRANEGGLKGVIFVKDPDGYWIEVVAAADLAKLGS